MSEQVEAISTANGKDTNIDEVKVPSTPERRKRSSSSSSTTKRETDPIIPSTPPRRDLPFGKFESPGDFASNTNNILPPTTPSISASGKFKLSNVPETPFSAKSSNEYNTSPLKSPSQFKDNDDSDKPPIRQISSTLKARLSYAFVKYQNGWANQSLDELEKSIINKDADLAEPFREFTSPQKKEAKTYEEFWSNNNPVTRSPHQKVSPHKVTKPTNNQLLKSPTKIRIDNADKLGVDEDDGSANRAFLQAISKSRSPKRRPHLQTNLRIDAKKYPPQNPEADAIESLMSLSSPQSFKVKHDIPHQQLPKQRLSFGESLSSRSGTSSQHQTAPTPSNEHAIATDSDTEYEQSNTTDEEDISTRSQSNDTKNVETDDDVDIKTASDSKSP